MTEIRSKAEVGSAGRLLWFGILTLPVHMVVQADLVWTLFEHPTSTLVRLYGGYTLCLHWATVMAALALAVRLVPVRRARLPLLLVATCSWSFFAQADWISYRNFHVHLLGFVQAGVFGQKAAMATAGIQPIAMLKPAAYALLSWAGFAAVAWVSARGGLPRLLRAAAAHPVRAAAVVLLALLADRTTYTLYGRRENQRITEFTESIPGYFLPPTRALVERLLPRMEELARVTERIHEGTPSRTLPLPYPDHVATSPARTRPNILILGFESFRDDVLSKERTPELVRFAERSTRCRAHYSNSTATHFGLFSLFYGLYPAAWWQIEAAGSTPLPLVILHEKGYRTALVVTNDLAWYSMQDFMFTPKGFDHIDQSRSVAYRERRKPGTGWTADVEAADAMLAELHASRKPFFGFLFFNSTHFHYYYPPDCAKEGPVYDPGAVTDLDFSAIRGDVIRRYHNSVRFADRLFKRILDGIDLENTIVVVTGDHAESLGEHGFFFHAGDFVEEQIHVPMLLHLPGRRPGTITHLTSHVDVFPTIFAGIGVRITDRGFRFAGSDMFSQPRPWTLVGAANVRSPQPTHFALIDDRLKLYFEVIAGSLRVTDVTERNDRRVSLPLGHPALGTAIDEAKEMLRQNVFH